MVENTRGYNTANLSKARIKFYYIDNDYYNEIKSGKRKVNIDYSTDIFVELIDDNFDMDKITGYIIARGGYHTHYGIMNFSYFLDYQANKPGYFTSDGKTYYQILGFLNIGNPDNGKVLVNLKKENIGTTEKIIFAGQSFNAIKHINSIMSEAKKSVFLIDGYIDEDVLSLFTDKSKEVEIRILTHDLKLKVQTFAKKFNLQYGNLHIRLSKSTHDRILIVDEYELYLLGASVKDIGLKTSILSKLETSTTIDVLKKYFDDEWDKSEVII